jgi:hypothetical protein
VPKRRLMKALSPGVPAAAIFLISASIVHAADECRPKPDSTAPSGSRWVYRINRADHRHCWFLSSKAGVPRSYSAQTNQHHQGAESERVLQDQKEGDPTAPTDNLAATMAAKPMQQSAIPSAEQSSEDLVPRSVPTVAYRLSQARAQAVTEPTVLTPSKRIVTPATANKLNMALLASAAWAGLCFAGGVFFFIHRIHRRESLRAVPDGYGGSERVGVTPLVDEVPRQIPDLIEGVDRSLRDLKGQRAWKNFDVSREAQPMTPIRLPHAATWLRRAKAGPRREKQLAEAY